jgi:heme oxygenase
MHKDIKMNPEVNKLDLSEKISLLLKSETSQVHDEVEQINIMSKSKPTIDNYIDYLKVLFKIFIPLEQKLFKFSEWKQNNFNFNLTKRVQHLIMDLNNLNVNKSEIILSNNLPNIDSFEKALGVYYVLEGSSLGGQILFKKMLLNYSDQLENKLNYLYGFGKETFKEWKIFIDNINNYAEINSAKKNDILNSALETFQCFIYEFNEVKK